MKKKLIKITFLMLLYSCMAKALSFFVRIYLARSLPLESMNYYSLASPTLLLLITLAQMGIPNAMSKLIASKKAEQSTLRASLVFSFVNNLLLFLVMVLLIPVLIHWFFKQNLLIPVFYSCLPIIPLVSLSGLCKGYLLGKQRMLLYSSCQVTEEVFRIGFLLLFLPLTKNPVILAKLALYSIAAGELGSSLHMLMGILFKRKKSFDFLKYRPNKFVYFSLLSIALPMTFSRLIGSFCYFLEPIVMLINVEESTHELMINTFTELNSFVQPIITLPSFISVMISNWALPATSEANDDPEKKKMIFYLSCGFTLLIGLLWSLMLTIAPETICMLLYKKTTMVPMLKSLALPFAFFGMQGVLSALIHGSGKSTLAFVDTLMGCLVRLGLMLWLPLFIREQSIPVSLAISMLTTTLLHLWHVVNDFFFSK